MKCGITVILLPALLKTSPYSQPNVRKRNQLSESDGSLLPRKQVASRHLRSNPLTPKRRYWTLWAMGVLSPGQLLAVASRDRTYFLVDRMNSKKKSMKVILISLSCFDN